MGLLDGRRIIVVGATGGIGQAIARRLMADGARVVGTGRDPQRLNALRDAGIHPVPLALDDPVLVGKAMKDALATHFSDGLDGLVIASGGYGPIGPTRSIDVTRLVATFTDNLVGPLAVIQAAADALDRGSDPSVAFLSGGGATDAFPNYSAYAISKVATVRLVENLAREERDWKVNAIAPGFVATAIHDATRDAGATATGGFLARTEEMRGRAVSPDIAGGLAAFLMSPESNGISGRLISAVWDPWNEPGGRKALRDDDHFGRLRRIDAQFFTAVPGEH